MGNLANGSNLVKISKVPKNFDFRRQNNLFRGIVNVNQTNRGYGGGVLPGEPAPDTNFILSFGTVCASTENPAILQLPMGPSASCNLIWR